MPISIEQPQPANFAAAYAGGYGDALSRAIPSIAELYATDMRNDVQQRMQTQELSARAGMQAAALDSQAQQFQDERQDRAAAFTASRMVQPLDQFHADVQFGLQRQHAQNQAWVAGQEWNQRYAMQRQQLANSLADVQADFASGKIDQDTYDQAVAHIRGLKGPLDIKFQRAQIDHVTKQNGLLDEQAKQAAQRDQAAKEFAAKGVGSRIATIPNPLARQQVEREFAAQIAAITAAGGPAAAEALIRSELAKRPDSMIHVWESAPGKWEQIKFPTPPTPAKPAAPAKPFNASQALRDAVAAAKAKYPKPEDQETDAYFTEVTNGFNQRKDAHEKSADGGQGSAPPPAGDQPPPAEKQKPFKLDDPRGASDVQRVVVDGLDRKAAAIAAHPGLSGEQKQVATFALQETKRLYAEYGDFDQMPDEVKKKIKQLEEFVQSLPPAPPQPAAPPAPPKRLAPPQQQQQFPLAYEGMPIY